MLKSQGPCEATWLCEQGERHWAVPRPVSTLGPSQALLLPPGTLGFQHVSVLWERVLKTSGGKLFSQRSLFGHCSQPCPLLVTSP